MAKSSVNSQIIKNTRPFSKCSYLSQVRRLRLLGLDALKRYSVNVSKVEFIHHGENATFKVTSKSGAKYLLRIHRDGYHSKEAILEELFWLGRLSANGQLVPTPVQSKTKELIVGIANKDLDLSRHCCLLRWIDGRFIDKSLSLQHMYKIGGLLANLQKNAPTKTSRMYWDANGLLGNRATFGSFDRLTQATPFQQSIITKARKKTLAKLKLYEKKYPNRMGLIHADLHFGNLLVVGSTVGAIDFDDCGFGFKVYDLVVPYISLQHTLGKKRQSQFESYRGALIDGYKSVRAWDEDDEKIFHHLVTSRRLIMLGWLNSRADNPKLKKRLKAAIKTAVQHVKEHV